MITEEEYEDAIVKKDLLQETINQYHKEANDLFEERMKNNPIFKDDELIYSAFNLCSCGYGLAYPKGCSVNHYWDCSAILKGIADKSIKHTGKLSFIYYSIKGENENQTTRGLIPKEL